MDGSFWMLGLPERYIIVCAGELYLLLALATFGSFCGMLAYCTCQQTVART
jgi:hypothetical protein